MQNKNEKQIKECLFASGEPIKHAHTTEQEKCLYNNDNRTIF